MQAVIVRLPGLVREDWVVVVPVAATVAPAVLVGVVGGVALLLHGEAGHTTLSRSSGVRISKEICGSIQFYI